MKTIVRMMGALALVVVGRMAVADTVIYKQDFESGAGEAATVAGQLVGQDGWFSVSNGTGLKVAVGTGNGNLGYLNNMQVVPNVPQATGNIVARSVAALDPTQAYKLTFDADDYIGGFGLGGADGNYKVAIRYDGPTMALTGAVCWAWRIRQDMTCFHFLARATIASRSKLTLMARRTRSLPITTLARGMF